MKYIIFCIILVLASAIRMPSNYDFWWFLIIESVSVKKVGDKWVFSEGIDESAIAYAKITATMNSTGRIPLLQ